MAGEPKSEHQRERTAFDPVLKFLFDNDRDEILRLMLGTPVRVVRVLDSVVPSSEQRSDGDWLLSCPDKGYFVPIESESTDTL